MMETIDVVDDTMTMDDGDGDDDDGMWLNNMKDWSLFGLQ